MRIWPAASLKGVIAMVGKASGVLNGSLECGFGGCLLKSWTASLVALDVGPIVESWKALLLLKDG